MVSPAGGPQATGPSRGPTADAGTADVAPPADEVRCHAKACDAPATAVCASCARPCCAAHTRSVRLERREVPSEVAGRRGMLERTPTYFETYVLCLPCSTKPFAGRPRRPS